MREDGEGKESVELRPLGGAGSGSRHVPTAPLRLAQPVRSSRTASPAPPARRGSWSLPPERGEDGLLARDAAYEHSSTLQHACFIIYPLSPSSLAADTLAGSTGAPQREATAPLALGVGPLTNMEFNVCHSFRGDFRVKHPVRALPAPLLPPARAVSFPWFLLVVHGNTVNQVSQPGSSPSVLGTTKTKKEKEKRVT